MNDRDEASAVTHRFRPDTDWFVAGEAAGIHALRIGATSERAVDLLHALAVHLPDEIDVALESLRDGQAWRGAACPRAEARDVVARLKLLLAGYGGVELALYTGEDQLTLTPELELFVYSRLPGWRTRLLEMGLEERAAPPPATWHQDRGSLGPAPELHDALAGAVRRLRLTPVAAELTGA